jgi:hypothetical protein
VTRHFIDRASLAIIVAFPPDRLPAAPAWAFRNTRNFALAVYGWIATPYLPAGKESHKPSYSREIQPLLMNEVPNGLDDPQIIQGIEATMGRSSDRTNQPLFFIEAKGGYGDCYLPGREANGKSGRRIQ